MDTDFPSQIFTSEAITALNALYAEAVCKEGLQPSDLLLERVRTLHLAALTPGLVMRAFLSVRQDVARRSKTTTGGAAKTPPKA